MHSKFICRLLFNRKPKRESHLHRGKRLLLQGFPWELWIISVSQDFRLQDVIYVNTFWNVV